MKSYYKKVFFVACFCFACSVFSVGGVFAQENSEIKEKSTDDKEAIPKDVEQLDFANGLFQRGLYKMAAKEYEKFIKLYPESDLRIDAYYGSPESLFFAKSYKKAIDKFGRYMEFFPGDDKISIAQLRIGQSYFLVENFDESIQSFHAVDQSALPGKFQQILFYYLGKSYLQQGEKNRSLESYKRAVEVPVRSKYVTQSLFDMGEIYSKDKNYKEAIKVYTKARDMSVLDQSRVQALFKSGEMSFLARDFEVSIASFKQIIEEFPEEDIAKDAFSNLISALYNTYNYSDIIKQFEENKGLIKKESNFAAVGLMTARAHLQLGQYEETINVLNEVLSDKNVDKETERQSILIKAESLVRTKMFQEAIVLIRKNPFLLKENDSETLFWRAESHYGLKEFDKSFELYKRIVEEFSDSYYADDSLYSMAFTKKLMGSKSEAIDSFIKYYNEGRNENRQQEALYNGILLEVQLDQIDDVLDHGEEYIEKYPKGEQVEKVLYLLGTLYTENEEHENAVRILREYEKTQKEEKRMRDVYFLLAHNLQQIEKYDGSLKYYKILIDQGEDALVYPALKNAALIYSNLNRFGEAAKNFDKIINEYEDNDLDVDVYIWLAQQRIKEMKYDEVLHVLEKSVGSGGYLEKEAIVSFYMAEAYKEKSEFEKAIDKYNIVLSREENDQYMGAAHIGKGVSMRAIGQYDGARKEFEAALKDNADDNTITMKARFELAANERKKGNLEDASKFFLLVAVLYDDSKYCPSALYSAGQVFEEMGSSEEAVKVYKEVIEKYEGSEFYSKARERLDVLGEG